MLQSSSTAASKANIKRRCTGRQVYLNKYEGNTSRSYVLFT
ncbi:hypothetical protein RHI9324_04535 [Rhizobium sp. CECT 9324]|nr:hypothetical protein RHI9324_04535 [Rhizobium sp. CECT 9324]